MRKVIPKDAIINGEGKGYPYTVVADLAGVGVVCKTADGTNEILQPDTITAQVTYSIKLSEAAPSPEAETPPTDKTAKADKVKEVK